jgi:heme exporter protein A
MLSVTGLSCARGERTLFEGLSFSLGEREWLHIQGQNGAGKTTLMRALVGLSPPVAGDITWRGEATPSPDFFRDLVYLGHHAAVKEELTPLENLCLSAALDGVDLSERDALAALIRLGLRGREDLPVRVLSAGQKRRVLLSRLLVRPARLWVLDEPFTALDVKAVAQLSGLIVEHVTQGGMAILTSHQAIPLANGKTLQVGA